MGRVSQQGQDISFLINNGYKGRTLDMWWMNIGDWMREGALKLVIL
jgi:hypothetical protein